MHDNAKNIYSRTGGNPLALKLTVGLLHAWPLETVLTSLDQGPGGDVEALYRHIFESSWQTLSPDAHQLLQAMPLAGDKGAEINQLQTISGLAEIKLREAIKELVTRSLIEMRTSSEQPCYGIHGLTDTFLRGQLLPSL